MIFQFTVLCGWILLLFSHLRVCKLAEFEDTTPAAFSGLKGPLCVLGFCARGAVGGLGGLNGMISHSLRARSSTSSRGVFCEVLCLGSLLALRSSIVASATKHTWTLSRRKFLTCPTDDSFFLRDLRLSTPLTYSFSSLAMVSAPWVEKAHVGCRTPGLLPFARKSFIRKFLFFFFLHIFDFFWPLLLFKYRLLFILIEA